MPPAFNLSQDQTLQFDLFTKLRSHRNDVASAASVDTSAPRQPSQDPESSVNSPASEPRTRISCEHQQYSLTPQHPPGLNPKRPRRHRSPSAPTPIGCKLLKSPLKQRSRKNREHAPGSCEDVRRGHCLACRSAEHSRLHRRTAKRKNFSKFASHLQLVQRVYRFRQRRCPHLRAGQIRPASIARVP